MNLFSGTWRSSSCTTVLFLFSLSALNLLSYANVEVRIEGDFPRGSAHPSHQDGESDFTDRTLENLLNTSVAGVIYAWSPEMPYSIEGLLDVKKAAESVGAVFIPVLDPSSDVDMAMESLKQYGLQDQFRILQMRSEQLLVAGMTVHFPSLIVFKEKKLISPIYPGLQTVARYRSFILEKLK